MMSKAITTCFMKKGHPNPCWAMKQSSIIF